MKALRLPIFPIPGSEYDIEIDQLIPAIGQRPDLSAIEDVTGLTFSRWGTTDVDSVTFATEREGVFAGGDLQTGPWVAIGAIGAGKEAAESILRSFMTTRGTDRFLKVSPRCPGPKWPICRLKSVRATLTK